jgi:hypothetical protein
MSNINELNTKPQLSLFLNEIFEQVGNVKTKEEKIKILQYFSYDKPMLNFLSYCYDETKYQYRSLPFPEYRLDTKTPAVLFPRCLKKVIRSFDYFLDTPTNIIPDKKLTQMLIQILESIPGEEALILKSMFEKRRVPYAGITKKLLAEAYPDFFGHLVSSNKSTKSDLIASGEV